MKLFKEYMQMSKNQIYVLSTIHKLVKEGYITKEEEVFLRYVLDYNFLHTYYKEKTSLVNFGKELTYYALDFLKISSRVYLEQFYTKYNRSVLNSNNDMIEAAFIAYLVTNDIEDFAETIRCFLKIYYKKYISTENGIMNMYYMSSNYNNTKYLGYLGKELYFDSLNY